jgi:hypothetical protein
MAAKSRYARYRQANRNAGGDRDAILVGNRSAAGLSRQPGAGLHHGHHSHGAFIDARGDCDLPALWPEPVLGDDPAGGTRHNVSAGAVGFRSDNPGDRRDLCRTDRADHPWNTDRYFPVADGWHNRNDALCVPGTDDAHSPRYFSHLHNCQLDCTSLAVRNTSYVVSDRFCRLDDTEGVIRDGVDNASVCLYCNLRTDAVDGTGHGLPLGGGQHRDNAADHDDVRNCIGDHPHARRRQHDRDRVAIPARQPLDRRMQFYARRPPDQWRGPAALDAGNSGEPAARHNSAGRRAARRHQHRSGDGGYTNAEHVGMRREHDDESGSARHDGTGQRHRRRGHARRIAAAGLLTVNHPDQVATTKGGYQPPFVLCR